MKKLKPSFFIRNMILFMTILLFTSALVPYILLINLNNGMTTAFAIRNGVISVVVGAILTTLGIKSITNPINSLSNASQKVAQGDFKVHVAKEGHHVMTDLIDNFNLMVSQLSKNENLQKDFVSNVSHEFKTPIASIAGYAELLKTENLTEEKRMEYAQIISNQTSRLTKLSANLLRLSELENKAIGMQPKKFSLDEQIRDAILLLQREWEEKQIHLEIELEEVSFSGDRELLYQVWVNIIENAIKFTPEKGQITIQLKQLEKIQVTIEDTGIGIGEEQLPKIFDRFYKGDSSHASKGTGLGLSIVKKIVEIHNGTISFESKEKIGTKVTILL